MPTYEYKCPNGHPYTETRSVHETLERTTCPKPGCGLRLERVFSSTPVHFKGRGFYSTGG